MKKDKKMKLSELLESVPSVKYSGKRDVEISSVTDNSKDCKTGSIFVAIDGHKSTGMNYTEDAYRRGARVFVLPRKPEKKLDAIVIYSNNTRKTLAELCSAFFGHPEKKLVCVGITGTKGKTTTGVVLREILAGFGVETIAVGTVGTVGLDFESKVFSPNTTPAPTVLFPLLAKACEKGIKVAVIEVSSQSLKDFRVYGIPFEFTAFTGLSRDHIGELEHPTFKDYMLSKRSLFSSYSARVAVVNSDDFHSSYMSACVARVVRCGFGENSDFKISKFSDSPKGSEFCVSDIKVESSMPGKYNAINISIALALACEITGESPKRLAPLIKGVRVRGRFETTEFDGKNIVVDYAHNSESFKEILTLARRLFPGRIFCVFGSVGERSRNRRRELAEMAERYSDFSVITSDNSGAEPPVSICSDIYSSFADKTRAKIILNRADAIAYALSEAKQGDAVMILGKGDEKYADANGGAEEISDMELVRSLSEKKIT